MGRPMGSKNKQAYERAMVPIWQRIVEKLATHPVRKHWIWTGAVVEFKGMEYGVIGNGGRGTGTSLVHRVMYERYKGPIPEGLEIDHLCRMPLCCNPDHLEAVTHVENIRRGRSLERMRAVQIAKTHCPQGHPYDDLNTQLYCGKRVCMACKRYRGTRAYRRRLRSQ